AYTAIGFYVLLQILPIFDIDLKPLLASAGVVGLGISFGAQSIFKDMLNGIFILLEDQFNVGDSVKMAGLTGTVEDMSLRCTILRDGDGTQNIIPNSQITTVQNLSRDYSVASLHVSVDASENPDKVMELLGQLAMEVRKDTAFAQVTIEDPKVLGVDKINGSEVLYLVNTKVRANQKDGVLRELRRRILLGFEKNQIRLGIPSSAVIVNAQDPTLPSAPTTVLGGGD
ncbi:mechanosensitive ion channel family protein, partial [Terriglobus sp. YAF25]